MTDSLETIFRGRRVLVTGHTGFKGSWLCLWLKQLGARVAGYALAPHTSPSHWDLLRLDMPSVEGDICNLEHLARSVREFEPEIVFHLAAQTLVGESYRSPLQTFEANVQGSLNVYEACRRAGTVRAVVSITTDKVYDNREWEWGYREVDALGGRDPYSASKACAEIASASYRDSFWPLSGYGSSHQTLLCTARAGNVVGGGDWASNRLVPDLMRAASSGEPALIRNPDSVRPWQHVLEPLCGYLLLGARLLNGDKSCAEGWNFGPADDGTVSVREVVARMQRAWGAIEAHAKVDPNAPHEARLLRLDCSKARTRLDWQPVWDSLATVEITAAWYRAYYERGQLFSLADIARYTEDARKRGVALV
ncbi:MAG: CDP-glucose 4,6-dehydratase [Polyangiaceae bacterium]